MWSSEVDHRVIKPSSVVADRPCASWDEATANAISTHTHVDVHADTRAHRHTQCAILVVASSCDLYSCDLFIFTQTYSELDLFLRWREKATTSSVLLFFCVEDKIQEDLGVGEVGLRSVLEQATHSGGAKRWFW